jgi:hypothetical protein
MRVLLKNQIAAIVVSMLIRAFVCIVHEPNQSLISGILLHNPEDWKNLCEFQRLFYSNSIFL